MNDYGPPWVGMPEWYQCDQCRYATNRGYLFRAHTCPVVAPPDVSTEGA